MDVDVGTVIAGKYELVRLLGKGAMGEVWLAKHDTLGGDFAVKLVETADDIEAETAAGRFQLEAQIAAKLSRKTRHIVSVSDHGEEDGRAYLVMELLEGESLEARIKRGDLLDLAEVTAIVSQVARALDVAHAEGIFHRDLKPANVFLTKDEDGRLCVKLLDFGIARTVKPFRTKSPFATSKDMVLGTPSYMSPEQARGLDTLDYRCDLWALAVVTFEALTGRIPFEGKTVEDIFLSICTFKVIPIRSLRPDLPPLIDGFFSRAFANSIELRFAHASEMSAELEKLVDPAALDAALGVHLGPGSSRRMLAAPRASQPSVPDLPKSFDPEPVAMGQGTARIPKHRMGGWMVALAGAVAILAFVSAGFLWLRRGEPNAGATTAAATPPPPPVETALAPPPPPEPIVEPVAPPPTVATVTPPETTAKPSKPPKPTAAKTPKTTTPSPPPSAKPAMPRSTDKDNVF